MVLTDGSGPLLAGLALAPELDETGNLCVFAMLTGKPCPACGGTRVFLDLAQLDVAAAVQHNLLITAGIFVALVTAMLRWRSVLATVRAADRVERTLATVAAPMTRWPMLVPVGFVLAWAWNLARW